MPRELRGRALLRVLCVLRVIGAHRFDALRLVDRLFPALRQILLFEPKPGAAEVLRQLAAKDAPRSPALTPHLHPRRGFHRLRRRWAGP